VGEGMFAPLPGSGRKPAGSVARGEWVSVCAVPANAPAAPETHPTLAKPVLRHAYHDAAGGLMGYVARFDIAGGKQFLPLTWCRHTDTGNAAWRWKSWPVPRPLYGLDRLATRPDAPVIVCEGEKATDAASRLLPDYVAVTSSHGSKSAAKADWVALRQRHVVIWPDADETGDNYAAGVVRCLAAIGVAARVLPAQPRVPEGWDAHDAERDGWTQARTLELVQQGGSTARSALSSRNKDAAADAKAEAARNGRRGAAPPQRDQVLQLLDGVELWHDGDREAFATMPVNGHFENVPVRSREFRLWITGRYYAAHRGAPGTQAFEEALGVIEASAVNDGPCHATFLRVGEFGGRLLLDLGGPDWRAIEMGPMGWQVIDRAPCKFLRSRAMRALPVPEPGECIETLHEFVNSDDADFNLFVAWLVASLRPRGPYPILVIGGEQGASKTTVSRLARGLVDPNVSPIRAAPKDDRDLLVAAVNSWVLALDNLSAVPAWLSDALCRIATGGGFSTRTLHSDRDETVFTATRPLILNGITDLAARPDLQDRALCLSLPAIPEAQRRPEREFWDAFDAKAPTILGALLDGACAGLRNLASTRLDHLPRMADFALWAEAAAPGLGWEDGEFSRLYAANRAGAVQVSLENSIVAQVLSNYILSRVDPDEGFSGTASELLVALEADSTETMRRSRSWPRSAAELGGQLRRMAPPLRSSGIAIDWRREGQGRKRMLHIRRITR